MAADPCCRNHAHPEYPLSAPCRRKRCTYAVLSFCGGSDFADNFYFIHIPGDHGDAAENKKKIGDHDVTQLVEKYMDDIIFI